MKKTVSIVLDWAGFVPGSSGRYRQQLCLDWWLRWSENTQVQVTVVRTPCCPDSRVLLPSGREVVPVTLHRCGCGKGAQKALSSRHVPLVKDMFLAAGNALPFASYIGLCNSDCVLNYIGKGVLTETDHFRSIGGQWIVMTRCDTGEEIWKSCLKLHEEVPKNQTKKVQHGNSADLVLLQPSAWWSALETWMIDFALAEPWWDTAFMRVVEKMWPQPSGHCHGLLHPRHAQGWNDHDPFAVEAAARYRWVVEKLKQVSAVPRAPLVAAPAAAPGLSV